MGGDFGDNMDRDEWRERYRVNSTLHLTKIK